MASAIRSHDTYLSRTVPDRESGRHSHEVGIRCRKCGTEEWAKAPQPGWGRRIFKNRGWDCGNTANAHMCPSCLTKRRARNEIGREAERLAGATIHQLHTPQQELSLPELAVETAVVRVLPITSPPEEATLNAHTNPPNAFADALAPLARKIRARGQPHGYSSKGNANHAAREALTRLSVARPTEGVHWRSNCDDDGTWSYALIGHQTPGLGGGANRHGQKIVEGYRVGRRDAAERSAVTACHRLGVGEPKEGEHFEIRGAPGDGYVYRIIQAPAHPTHGEGYLSRFDAKKAAFEALAPHRKTGGAPAEGVDYWVSQNGFNLWGWSTTNPNPAPAPEPAPRQEPTVSDASTQAVRDLEEAKRKAEPPREPTRADNRRIRDCLDEHYDEARSRYRGDWGDALIATALDLPRAWIARVREEFYGPDANEANDVELRKRRENLDRAVALGEKVLSKAQAGLELLAELETALAELKAARAEV